jgi:hypothetical protein
MVGAEDMDIPCTYATVPTGFTEGSATHTELQAAGFYGGADLGTDKPGEQPLDEMLLEGLQVLGPDVAAKVLRQGRYGVLCGPDGNIVATWDEGRWWTPEESDEFTRRIVAERGQSEGDA